jgi:hypothetical protein
MVIPSVIAKVMHIPGVIETKKKVVMKRVRADRDKVGSL